MRQTTNRREMIKKKLAARGAKEKRIKTNLQNTRLNFASARQQDNKQRGKIRPFDHNSVESMQTGMGT